MLGLLGCIQVMRGVVEAREFVMWGEINCLVSRFKDLRFRDLFLAEVLQYGRPRVGKKVVEHQNIHQTLKLKI